MYRIRRDIKYEKKNKNNNDNLWPITRPIYLYRPSLAYRAVRYNSDPVAMLPSSIIIIYHNGRLSISVRPFLFSF